MMHKICFAVILLAIFTGAVNCRAEIVSRPNIVLIMCDDMGFSDIGCYGGEVMTPNLDRLAREGMRFTQFYNNAKCTTTRASFVTDEHQQLAWYWSRNRALRQGRWKIVWDKAGEKRWKLYDLATDRCETSDLAQQEPARVERMAAAWFAWADKVGLQVGPND